MLGQPYKRPPITEAVIELRFATAIDAADLDKASRTFASLYPHQLPVKNLGVAVGLPDNPEMQPTAHVNQQVGYRRSSTDLTEILLLWPTTLAVAQLAPYPGWDEFFGRFVRDWKAWKKATGYRKIGRIGLRFINRIDIPLTNGVIEESQYLNVYPQLPDVLGQVAGYGVQVQLPIRDMGCSLIINSAAVPSPLLGHGSFLLDLDISMETSPPQNDEAIYDLLNQARVKKNDVFEACITSQARELFRK